jgi:hypothetical protein
MSESAADPATAMLRAEDTESRAPAAPAPPTRSAVHEAYAFACFNCGYGWEQEYEIEHRPDTQGRPGTYYRANGVPVPSPLTKPSCPGCGGTHVRIMRAGRVAEAAAHWHAPLHPLADEDRGRTETGSAQRGKAMGGTGGSAKAEPAKAQSTPVESAPAEGGKAEGGKAEGGKAEAQPGAGSTAPGPTDLEHPEPRAHRRLHLPFHFRLRREHHSTPRS